MTTIRVASLFAALLFAHLAHAAEPAPREVVANGQGEVKVAPDEVLITLAVESLDRDILAARAKTDEHVKKVLALTGTFKIDPRHVQTDRITIEPRYRNNDRTDLIGFVARKSIVICLKDMARFEELLTAVLKAGTNNLEGVQFLSTQLRKHRDEARIQALRAAREKAAAMAKELGARLGKVRLIEEGGSSFGRLAYANASSNAGADGPGADGFAPGQISITADVTVRFELID
jgi:uncharacterized protein YggE